MGDITIITLNCAFLTAFLVFAVAAVVKTSRTAPRLECEPPEITKGKVPDWFYGKLDLLGLGLIIGVFYMLVMGNLMMMAEVEPEKEVSLNVESLILSIGFQFFSAFIAFIIVFSRVGIVKWLGLKWKEWPWVFLVAPVTVVTMWLLFSGIYVLGYENLMERLGVQMQQDTVKLFQDEKDPLILILMAFTAAIVAPICEEIVFRGYLYPAAKKFVGPWVAGFCTALIFSAAHGGLAPLLPLFIFGLALVALYEWTGSIWAPIAAHFLFNSATVAIQLAVRYELIELPVQP
ncbi:MAG: CPBP family intramembrane glutamic endopeptidase [Luteolibacter sp.]